MPDAFTLITWDAAARIGLAARLAEVPAERGDAPSLCEGWRVRT